MPPQIDIAPDQLIQIIRSNHLSFVLSEDCASVRVVDDSVPERDASAIVAELVTILELNGPLTVQKLLVAFSVKRQDCIYVNKSIAKKLVLDRSDVFGLQGEVVSLVGKVNAASPLPLQPDGLVVQRCTYLILNGKWRTLTEATCTADWLCCKLASMPPHVIVNKDQLIHILERHHARFSVSEDGSDVRVANGSVPEADSAVIGRDLASILELNGSLSLNKLLDVFSGTKRNDYIYLSKSLIMKFVQDRSDLFRLDGEEVSLVGRAAVQSDGMLEMQDYLHTPTSNDSHEEIDLDFLSPLSTEDEEEIIAHETTKSKMGPPPKSSGLVEKLKKLFHF